MVVLQLEVLRSSSCVQRWRSPRWVSQPPRVPRRPDDGYGCNERWHPACSACSVQRNNGIEIAPDCTGQCSRNPKLQVTALNVAALKLSREGGI